ncbi:MAG: class I adenylate-forming enzyme family protein [Pseudomonadota bacterium]
MRPFLTLHTPSQAKAYYDQGLWASETFYSLLVSHASARPTDFALRDGRQRLTWEEVLGRVGATAANLRKKGLVAGDRVSVWMSNRIEAVILFLACNREGIVCNPSLHRTHTCAEIVELLTRLNASALLTEPGWGADRHANDLDAMLAGLGSLRQIYTPESLPKLGAAPDTRPSDDPDSVIYLAFTSGTTGAPKCVMHSCNTLLSNARDMVRAWGHNEHTKLLSLSPLSHHIAWVGVAQWLLFGGEFITDLPPDGASRLDWVTECEATYVMGVPTHAIDLLAEQKARGAERLASVKTFYMAGAPIPPSVAEAFVAQGIKPQNVYGMTENSSHQFTDPGDTTATITSTCGRGGPAYEVSIFDSEDADRVLAPGQTGQIGGRGACLMLGYYGNQEATEGSYNSSGWFLSGDLGQLDEAGNLEVSGRLKDLIIRGGHNIYPTAIEALALRHPGVEKAAAFSVRDERLGERVCIAVLGHAPADDLLSHLAAEGLSIYDMPEYYLAVDEFPLTASGKILKRDLIEMVARGEVAPEPVRYEAKGAGK